MIEVRGVFPLWVARETGRDSNDGRAGVSWFKEVDRPYRKGRGVWLRLGKQALHVGVQWRSGAKSDIDVLGYDLPDVDGEVIGGWQRDDPEVPKEDV